MTIDTQYVLLAFNVVFGIAAFFGGMVIKDLSNSVKDLRQADKELTDSLKSYATKDELKDSRTETRDTLREMRDEQRDGFRQVFDLLNDMRNQIATKADRAEVR